MKLAKWNEKTTAFLDTLLSHEQTKAAHVIYSNTDTGVFFADTSGHWARFLPDEHIYSVNPQYETHVLPKFYEEAAKKAVRADSITVGTAGKKKCRKFQNGDIEVYAYETLLRGFPANADFYISGPNKPIVVSIWENDRINDIGLVMPFLVGATSGFMPA